MISGASAATAANIPSSASDNPIRAPTRSSRDTSSQLVVRLTPAAKANTTASNPSDTTLDPGHHDSDGVRPIEGLWVGERIWVHGSVP